MKGMSGVDLFRQRVMTGGFEFAQYTHRDDLYTGRIKRIQWEQYRGTPIMRLETVDESGMFPTPYSGRFSLKTISGVIDVGHQFRFTLMPFYVGAREMGPSTIVLSTRPFRGRFR